MEIQECEFERLEAVDERYWELIMAVENKYPGETRHKTALRLIREAQRRSSDSQRDSRGGYDGHNRKIT